MKFIEKGILETPGFPMEREEKGEDTEPPWQSELELTIRWAVFKHLDLRFLFPCESGLGYTAKWFGYCKEKAALRNVNDEGEKQEMSVEIGDILKSL